MFGDSDGGIYFNGWIPAGPPEYEGNNTAGGGVSSAVQAIVVCTGRQTSPTILIPGLRSGVPVFLPIRRPFDYDTAFTKIIIC
jgi:hypothetical protein